MFSRKPIFLVVIILFCLFIGSKSVIAGAGLSLQPAKVSHTLNPGETISGELSLANVGESRILVEVKMEDFVPSAGSDDISFVGRTSGVTTVRDWFSLGTSNSFIFEPHEGKSISYTITAPKNAEPGSHFGVAFFKASEIKEKSTLKIGTQVGVLFFITVPGNRLQKGKVLDFSAPFFVQKGPVNFEIKFENTGTVHYEPKGTIKITNIIGKEVGSIVVAGQAVLPTQIKKIIAQWNLVGFILGRYTVKIEIQDGEGNILTADDVSFYAFPIWYVLGFIAIVLILFFGLRFLRKKISFNITVKR